MSSPANRKYPRYSDHAPILYAGYNSQSYRKAMMQNSCFDGMYFVSDSSQQPRCDLYIKVQQGLTRSFEPDPCKDFRARVQWCRPVTAAQKPSYGIGVHFTAKSHLSYGINIDNPDYRCDLCEKRVTDRLIHRTESWLHLCPNCLNYMEMLSSGSAKALERFLLGNVV